MTIKRIVRILAIASLFMLVSLFYFYPVILNLNKYIPVFSSTDEPFGVIWSFWWMKYAFLNKISVNAINVIAFPFGIVTNSVSFFPLWSLFVKYLSIMTNEILAYNVILLSTFVLSALSMYWLVFTLTKNTMAGIFCALIYAFCPFHIVRSWQHFGTAQIQWMPLFILLLFKLYQIRKLRLALSLGIALALNYYFDVHYAYFMLIAAFIFFLLAMLVGEKNTKIKFVILLATGIIFGLVIIIPAFLPLLSNLFDSAGKTASARSFVRPFEDLFSQSARPLSYFLPFTEQPIFGNFTKMFIGSDIWGESLTEHNIFLGYTPLFLAFLAIVKRKYITVLFKKHGVDISFSLKFFFCLVIGAWLFSQPPWWNIFGLKLYMPSFFMYKILPMFRAYVRFGVLVMLGISVLAGFGLVAFLERFRTRVAKISAVVLVCALSLFEFWSNPAEHAMNLGDCPKAYEWLKAQPGDFVVVEYPLDLEGPNETYKFYQTKHHKKLINGALPGTRAHGVMQTLKNLSSPDTISYLGSVGVKYALVHTSEYVNSGLTENIDELFKINKIVGLKLIMSIDGIDIYEVKLNKENH